jgi:hypothetical protein
VAVTAIVQLKHEGKKSATLPSIKINPAEYLNRLGRTALAIGAQ